MVNFKPVVLFLKIKYTLYENARLQAWGCPEQGFYDVAKDKYG